MRANISKINQRLAPMYSRLTLFQRLLKKLWKLIEQRKKTNTTKPEEIDPHKVIVNYEIGASPVDLEFCVMYQPPDYVDPIQPTKEEIEE